MANKIPGSARGQLDSMLRLGAAGDLSDGQLLDRVDASRGEPAEAAFALLVDRHAPMVLRVCRDAIGNPHDAEDACQAVFLVLARKASSVRRRESAAAWLFGVARKVSSRARRDEARRRRHERRKAELAARSLVDATHPESWDELYEEIDRLPEVYRSAVVLCHLEGLAHEEAASRLGCPLRTLQSRLLRARAKLKDRLGRRGVAPGALAWLGSSPSPSPLPAKFAALTTRIALSGPDGMVPAAVSSLADGVLAMSLTSKLIPALVVLLAVGVASGFSWAVGSKPAVEPVAPRVATAVVKAAPEAIEQPEARGPITARGVVVDESGRAVAGAEVLADAFTTRESRGVSAVDGSFAVPVRDRRIDGTSLHARSLDGSLIGNFRYGFRLTPEQANAPSRVVLKPGRKVAVRVADASKATIEGATIDVIGRFEALAEGTTGLDGSATLVIPADAKVEWIIALKSARGLDYAEFGEIDEDGRNQGGIPASDLPATVPLVLDGARPVKIRAVDAEGKPLAGVGFGPWLIRKEGRRSQLNLGDYRAFAATTGPDGVATFDWMPPIQQQAIFWPRSEGFARRRVVFEPDTTGPVTTRLGRTETIRGHVFRPDGSPAPGIRVAAIGSGTNGIDQGSGSARSAPDGSYELVVNAGEGYAVYVEDDDWAAPSRLDIALHQGSPVNGVDFRLVRATVVRGRVLIGPGDRPAPEQSLWFEESGSPEFVEKAGLNRESSRQTQRQIYARTDAEGLYSVRVGPGIYTVTGPARMAPVTIVVKDEPELAHDFRMPRPEKGSISGKVVDARTGRPVGGAKVDFLAVNPLTLPIRVMADADGKFQAERLLDKLVVCAKSADGALGAIVEVADDESEVVIPVSPTASASGTLLDEQGEPLANQKLYWGRRVYIDEKIKQSMTCFGSKVATDAKGKFLLPALVVGQEYEIGIRQGNSIPMAGAVRPESPAHVDLGTIRLGDYRPGVTAEEMSSFRKGGPGPGDPAPPIEATTLDGRPLKLDDFRGKFVLLDFWATWCGPCIGEIPQLQAIHEAFGKDDRFAILSLSVDEKVDEPRKFQEGRKLPWPQAFLGQGIHSAIPESFGVRAIPAFVLVGPDGKIVAKGMRGDDIKKEVAKALGKKP